jgi:hypothetical protein
MFKKKMMFHFASLGNLGETGSLMAQGSRDVILLLCSLALLLVSGDAAHPASLGRGLCPLQYQKSHAKKPCMQCRKNWETPRHAEGFLPAP